MRWHIGIFGKRKALFLGLVFLAMLCGFMMFHEVQGQVGRQQTEDGGHIIPGTPYLILAVVLKDK